MRTRASWAGLIMAGFVAACGSSEGGQLFPGPEDENEDVDAGTDVSTDAPPGVEPGGPCELDSECAAPSDTCRVAVCEEGVCAEAVAPAGTKAPDSAQVSGDCKRIECGEDGLFVTVADESDLPPDDGNDCTVSACEGTEPAHHAKASGQACGTNGTCDGAGQCVGGSATECTPHTSGCEGTMPRTCDAEGNWHPEAPCPSPYKCSAGACTITCVPGTKRCDGTTAQTCGAAGEWESVAVCQNGCLEGACTGICTDGAKRCDGKLAQECDGSGRWQTKTTCSFDCNAGTGSCTDCEPGTKRCWGSGTQTCGANGTWGATSNCVSPNGKCSAGVCIPNAQTCAPDKKDCQGNAVRTCNSDGSAWASTTSCAPSACLHGECVGTCAPGSKRCTGKQPETCNDSGQWEAAGPACGDEQGCNPNTAQCLSLPLSCNPSRGSGNGLTWCAPSENCCETTVIPGGALYRGNDGVSSSDVSRPAILTGLKLEKRQVTEARFRAFVSAVVKGFTPPVGSGKHAHLNGGAGLNGTETGWQASWNAYLPNDEATWKSAEHLMCSENATYDGFNGPMRPINCVNWYQAQAFCIWDGGFLPSELEWHYAASGGDEQRVYPWSSPATSTTIDDSFASYDCMGDGTAGCALKDILDVGKKEKGAGRWGQLDLSGNVNEWVFDAYAASYSAGTCSNCANVPTSDSAPRVIRGGSWRDTDEKSLYAVARKAQSPLSRSDTVGFRCAYKP